MTRVRPRALRRIAAPAGRLAARAGRELRELAAGLRRGAAREPRRRRIAWLAVALVLVGGPVAFNVARSPSYSASVDIHPGPVGPYAPVREVDYWRAFLDTPILRREMRRNVDARFREYRDATVRPVGRPPRLRVTVTAPTPGRARELVNALGPQLVGASSRQLARQVDRDLAALAARLRDARGRARRALRRRRAELRRLDAAEPLPPPRAVLGPRPATPPVRGWADEVADALPGEMPARRSPVWAGLAGLLLAATLWGIALVLVPPRR